MELNILGLRPCTFNCQLENVKSQKGYKFDLVNEEQGKPRFHYPHQTICNKDDQYFGLGNYSTNAIGLFSLETYKKPTSVSVSIFSGQVCVISNGHVQRLSVFFEFGNFYKI